MWPACPLPLTCRAPHVTPGATPRAQVGSIAAAAGARTDRAKQAWRPRAMRREPAATTPRRWPAPAAPRPPSRTASKRPRLRRRPAGRPHAHGSRPGTPPLPRCMVVAAPARCALNHRETGADVGVWGNRKDSGGSRQTGVPSRNRPAVPRPLPPCIPFLHPSTPPRTPPRTEA